MGLFDRVGRFLDDVLLLPEEVRSALEHGEAAVEAEAFEEAERIFLQVLADRPRLGRAAVGLAHARHGLGDARGTLEALKEARAILPEDPDLALWTARLALEHEEYDLAARAAGDASRARASAGGAALAEACAVAAWAEWGRGRPDRAARELRKALSADPERPDLRAALVEALAAGGHGGAARAAAAQVDASAIETEVATRVGLALARLGAADDARRFLEAAAEAGHAPARAALARTALDAGDLERAEERARAALREGAGAPALEVLGAILRAKGSLAEAAEALATAARANEDPVLLREALRTAPRDDAAFDTYLDELRAHAPEDPLLWVLGAWRAQATDEEALALVAGSTEVRAHLLRARAALDAGRPQDALLALALEEDALHPGDRAELGALRDDALRALWLGEDGALDLAAAIDGVRDFAETHDLDAVLRGARALRDELDRPLLLAVLGEFNAGKSTLINAFIGTEVAPMGIVPTTATLNVLRGGDRQRVRILRRDGSTREGDYASLRGMLDEAEALGSDASGAAQVDRVEIILPSETLERVWILDAPGTNALDPNHEKLAREAARRADAVLWVFDAAQAGKLTETRILEDLRAKGRHLVPALNKVDRLKPGELAEVSAVVQAGFGSPPVPISAKRALKARVAGDEAGFDEHFGPLLRRLEDEVFSRSRELKRSACAGRLVELLDATLADERTRGEALEEELQARDERREAIEGCLREMLLAVDDDLRVLEQELDAAFAEGTREVLAFVRPRANQLARHGVHREDRAFLAEMLEAKVRAAVDGCERRTRAKLRGQLARVGAELADDRVAVTLRGPLASFRGYQRGLLAGGTLRRFFEEVLPRAELDEEALGPALARGRADPGEELRPALTEAVESLHAELVREHDARSAEKRDHRRRFEREVLAPLAALRDAISA